MNENARSLEKESIGQLLLNYSLPAIIATTSSSLYNIIDRIFIGQGVGPYAISGLAITFLSYRSCFRVVSRAGVCIVSAIGERRYAAHAGRNATIVTL